MDNEKSKKFNKFIEGVEDHVAEKDANEFIKDCAICNKASVLFYYQNTILIFN